MNDQWLKRWEEGRISFHEGSPNDLLIKHFSSFKLGPTCLVPLCGKAVDMFWLAEQGQKVTGVELSEIAIRQFYEEHPTSMEMNLQLHHSDFFKFTSPQTFSWIYDRAALIALPEMTRKTYVAHQKTMLQDIASIILLSVEYASTELKGPPFSVSDNEVYALYSFAKNIHAIESRDPINSTPHLRHQLQWIRETLWKIDV